MVDGRAEAAERASPAEARPRDRRERAGVRGEPRAERGLGRAGGGPALQLDGPGTSENSSTL